jgi:hypothetical protein
VRFVRHAWQAVASLLPLQAFRVSCAGNPERPTSLPTMTVMLAYMRLLVFRHSRPIRAVTLANVRCVPMLIACDTPSKGVQCLSSIELKLYNTSVRKTSTILEPACLIQAVSHNCVLTSFPHPFPKVHLNCSGVCQQQLLTHCLQAKAFTNRQCDFEQHRLSIQHNGR